MMRVILLISLMVVNNPAFPQQGAEKPISFLALGDSYTIGESVPETDRWPVQLAAALRQHGRAVSNPRIIATTGWRTDDLKHALVAAHLKPDYGLVSLLIGVNNQFQGKTAAAYALEFEDLLTTSIGLAGGNKENVFVVSIPDYGYTPFGKERQPQVSKAIDEFNAVNQEIAAKHGVVYFFITDISREGLSQPDLLAGDGLHPSGKMYARWVDRIVKGLVR
jgi:lysophospholipase L1-like esterase